MSASMSRPLWMYRAARVTWDAAYGSAGSLALLTLARPEKRKRQPRYLRSRYEVIIRVAKGDGHSADPGTFAAAASQAASSRNASIASAHTAEEIIWVVGVAALERPSAVAVALTVFADALRATGLGILPELVVAAAQVTWTCAAAAPWCEGGRDEPRGPVARPGDQQPEPGPARGAHRREGVLLPRLRTPRWPRS